MADDITDDLAAALTATTALLEVEGRAKGKQFASVTLAYTALAAYDAAKAAQEQPVEDHFDTMVVKTAPAKSHREILAEELDKVKLHHSAARVRGEKNDGHLMTMEGPEAALAAMARVAAPAPDLLAASMKAANELRQAARALAKAGDHEAAAVADMAEERTRAAIAKAGAA